MTLELLNYETSILNPLLKLVNAILFGSAFILVYVIRRGYEGELRKMLNFLFLSFLLFSLGAFLRYFDHGISFGFTKEFSLKWFQSLSYLIGAFFLFFLLES